MLGYASASTAANKAWNTVSAQLFPLDALLLKVRDDVYGNFNLNGDLNGFGNYDGSGTATTTTYVPPQFHTQQTYSF